MTRPIVMWALMYWPTIAAVGIGVRWAAWQALEWPVTATAVFAATAGGVGWWAPVAALVWEVGTGRLVPSTTLWRRAAAVRRKWPTVWAVIDHATTDVQAAFGGGISTFHLTTKSRRLTRPILRHPPMRGWLASNPAYVAVVAILWAVVVFAVLLGTADQVVLAMVGVALAVAAGSVVPLFGADSVTWQVGPPPGTTLEALGKVEDAIAGAYAYPNVHSVEVHCDIDHPGASWGTITFWFERPPDADELEEIDADEMATAVWDGPNDLGWDTDPTTEMDLP